MTGTAMRANGEIMANETRDLNSPEAISELVDAFYARVLADPTLAVRITANPGRNLDAYASCRAPHERDARPRHGT